MKAIDRVYEYFAYKKIKPTRLEKQIGISNGYFGTQLKRKSNLGEGVLNKILESCLDLNPSWLLTGNGHMLKDVSEASSRVAESSTAYERVDEGRIPLIPIEAMVNWGKKDIDASYHELPSYLLPELDRSKVDFMIRVKGDEMQPKYHSGDIVICKKLPKDGFFQWNKVYVLATIQGLMVRRIKKSESENHINCVSDNPDYKAFKLELDHIDCAAIVLAAIHLE